ncbi:MAG: PEP-CTERM sorting domain-containing protein [Okeania sp. SIO3H1]|nr:PEP-CTERM sorting domain-containing protein [Okeania sp. SIO3H1]
MKTTKTDSLLSKATLFGKSSLLATIAVAASVTSAGAITLDFDQDSNGNALEAGTIVNGKQSYDSGINPWSGVEIRRIGIESKGITLFNSNCKPNHNKYSGYSGYTNNCTGGDKDLATGGSLNTQARGNVLIAQDSGRQTRTNGKFSDPGDQGNGSTIKFTFDEEVALGNIEFLDFDKTDANKIKLTARDTDDEIIAEYTFSRQNGKVIDNVTGEVFENSVRDTDVDEAFTGEMLTGVPYVEYFLANNGIAHEPFENSVWDFYFGEELGQVKSLEVNFNGISGAISELNYEKMYSDFLSEPKVRVPEPGSIAALAFIGGGMFLSRRRQSH